MQETAAHHSRERARGASGSSSRQSIFIDCGLDVGKSGLAQAVAPAREGRTRELMATQIFEGSAAKGLGKQEKWDLLSPFLRQHGRESLAYATLQEGMEYFVTED